MIGEEEHLERDEQQNTRYPNEVEHEHGGEVVGGVHANLGHATPKESTKERGDGYDTEEHAIDDGNDKDEATAEKGGNDTIDIRYHTINGQSPQYHVQHAQQHQNGQCECTQVVLGMVEEGVDLDHLSLTELSRLINLYASQELDQLCSVDETVGLILIRHLHGIRVPRGINVEFFNFASWSFSTAIIVVVFAASFQRCQ